MSRRPVRSRAGLAGPSQTIDGQNFPRQIGQQNHSSDAETDGDNVPGLQAGLDAKSDGDFDPRDQDHHTSEVGLRASPFRGTGPALGTDSETACRNEPAGSVRAIRDIFTWIRMISAAFCPSPNSEACAGPQRRSASRNRPSLDACGCWKPISVCRCSSAIGTPHADRGRRRVATGSMRRRNRRPAVRASLTQPDRPAGPDSSGGCFEWAALLQARGLARIPDGPRIEQLETSIPSPGGGRAPEIVVRHGLPDAGDKVTRRVGSLDCAVYGAVGFGYGRALPLAPADLASLPWIAFARSRSTTQPCGGCGSRCETARPRRG